MTGVALFVLLASQAPASNGSLPAVHLGRFGPYRECVIQSAARLEQSGDDPATVADAALTACAAHRLALVVSDNAGAPVRSEQRSHNDQMMSIIDRDLRDTVVLKVTSERAAKVSDNAQD